MDSSEVMAARAAHPGMTNKRLAEKLGISEMALKRKLKAAKEGSSMELSRAGAKSAPRDKGMTGAESEIMRLLERAASFSASTTKARDFLEVQNRIDKILETDPLAFGPLVHNCLMQLPSRISGMIGSGGSDAFEGFADWCFLACERSLHGYAVRSVQDFTREQRVGVDGVDLANKISCLEQMAMHGGRSDIGTRNLHTATLLYRDIDRIGPRPDSFYFKKLQRPYSEMRGGCAIGYAHALFTLCFDMESGLAEYQTALGFAKRLGASHPMVTECLKRMQLIKDCMKTDAEIKEASDGKESLFSDAEMRSKFQKTQGVVGSTGRFQFGKAVSLPLWQSREEIRGEAC